MPPRARRSCALLLALAGCAGAPAPLPTLSAVWPAPPAVPRVRLVRVFPDPARPLPRPPLWRRIIDAVAGTDPSAAPAAPLARPFGLAVEGEALLVADPELPGVIRILADGSHARVECASLQWSAPMAVAVAEEGAILVADAGAGRIVRIEPGGRCVALGEGSLERPTGVAVRGDRIYVVDPPRHELVLLDASGSVTARRGGRGSGPGQLHFPAAVALGPSGEVLVADTFNFGVAIWEADGSWRGRIAAGTEDGRAPTRPKGLAASPDGRVFLSDAERDEIVLFAPDGSRALAFGATGAAPGFLAHPAGLALDGSRLHVADSLNRRIQSFELLGGVP